VTSADESRMTNEATGVDAQRGAASPNRLDSLHENNEITH